MTETHRVFIAIALVAGAAGAAFMNRGAIGLAEMRRMAARTILSDTIATLPDGLHVGLCGTGSPFPSHDSFGPMYRRHRGRPAVHRRRGARRGVGHRSHGPADGAHPRGPDDALSCRSRRRARSAGRDPLAGRFSEDTAARYRPRWHRAGRRRLQPGLRVEQATASPSMERQLAPPLVLVWRHALSRFRPDKPQPSFSSRTACGSPRSTSTTPSAAPRSDTASTTRDEAWRLAVTRPDRRISSASRAELTC